jgi:hypothetical protein
MDERTRRLRELRRWGAPYDGLGMIPREDGTFVRWADVLAVLDTEGDRPTPQTKNTDDGLCQGTINGYVVCELPRGHEGPHGHAPALPNPPVQP